MLDIGTGQDALLARLALAAGARKVYAVEVIPEAAARATQLVRDLGQADRIEVICGDMRVDHYSRSSGYLHSGHYRQYRQL